VTNNFAVVEHDVGLPQFHTRQLAGHAIGATLTARTHQSDDGFARLALETTLAGLTNRPWIAFSTLYAGFSGTALAAGLTAFATFSGLASGAYWPCIARIAFRSRVTRCTAFARLALESTLAALTP
jgi:hypothetical protein